MTLYTPWLVTLDYVRLHRGLGDNAFEHDDDALLQQFIAEQSADFQMELGRTFVPYQAVRLQDYQQPYALDLDDDLLAVTTLTNGDTNVIPSGNFLLSPANEYPKWRIGLNLNTSIPYVYRADPRQAVAIDGIWGCVPHYATKAFRASGAVMPAGIDGAATTLALASGTGSGFEIGQYLRFATGELVQVLTHASDTPDTLTIARGEQGTTAAPQTAGTPIQQFYPLGDVMKAVRDLVAYEYLHKDAIGSRSTLIANGVVQVDDLDPSVQATFNRYQRDADNFEVI